MDSPSGNVGRITGSILDPLICYIAVCCRTVRLAVDQEIPCLVEDALIVRDTDCIQQSHHGLEFVNQAAIHPVDQCLDIRPGGVHPVDMDAMELWGKNLAFKGFDVPAVLSDPFEEVWPVCVFEVNPGLGLVVI